MGILVLNSPTEIKVDKVGARRPRPVLAVTHPCQPQTPWERGQVNSSRWP